MPLLLVAMQSVYGDDMTCPFAHIETVSEGKRRSRIKRCQKNSPQSQPVTTEPNLPGGPFHRWHYLPQKTSENKETTILWAAHVPWSA